MKKHRKLWRWWLIATIFFLTVIALFVRLIHLHTVQNDFLMKHSQARSVRVLPVRAPRGNILDRHGYPLAVSTKVMTLWVNPSQLNVRDPRWLILLREAKLDARDMAEKLAREKTRQFMYLRRQISPALAQKIMVLGLPGVYEQTTYKRFYPEAEASAQLLGVTSIDGKGLAGLEQTYETYLAGQSGQQRVVRDLKGNVIKHTVIKSVRLGKSIQCVLSARLCDVVLLKQYGCFP